MKGFRNLKSDDHLRTGGLDGLGHKRKQEKGVEARAEKLIILWSSPSLPIPGDKIELALENGELSLEENNLK